MSKFRFCEKEPQRVAGHGLLKPGDVVELSEKEALYVARTNSTSFVPVEEDAGEPEDHQEPEAHSEGSAPDFTAPVRKRTRKED